MAEKFDDIHYSYREIDGYNKPFNFVTSPRELGKTTTMWLKKIYIPWKKDHKPWIYLVRKSVEINSALIDSIADTILNKFTDDNVSFVYKVGSFKDGIVDVFIPVKTTQKRLVKDENGKEVEKEVIRTENILFFRIVSLNIDMRRIKLAVLKGVKGVFMDEYIINPKMDEHYIKNEANKIKEAYTTWRREADGVLKFYIVANPYSLFNPLFVDWDVDTNKLKIGSFYVGTTFVIHYPKLSTELYNMLLQKNPLFSADDFYRQYALEGQSVNDMNIRIGEQPQGFFLKFVFKHNQKYIGIFQNNDYSEDTKFFCKFVDVVSARRTIYCFDFAELVDRGIVMSLDERQKIQRFKEAFRKRAIVFEDINCYYFIEEIYKNI